MKMEQLLLQMLQEDVALSPLETQSELQKAWEQLELQRGKQLELQEWKQLELQELKQLELQEWKQLELQ